MLNFRNYFLLLVGILASTLSATPAATIDTLPAVSSVGASNPSLMGLDKTYKNAAYFTNYAPYGRDFHPQQLPAQSLTHVLYAFAGVNEDGTIFLTDNNTDVEKHYPTDSWEPGNNVYGCIKQLYILKRQDRKMKTLLSIGGWGSDKNFSPMANNPAGRARFASMAVQFVKDLGFDGIDIDWEFPKTGVDAENFVLLLEALRSALDKYAEEYAPGYHFLMTVASPGGPREYNIWHLGAMDRYLDAWHLMTYDYSGSWNDRTGHSSNLHGSTEKPKSTPYTTEKTVTAYIEAGVSPDKIILGVPVYGHSFQATTGFGQPFNGEGEKDEAKGSWDKGVWDYKVLPKAGATEHFDEKLGASWSYDEVTKELISYDNSQVAKLKASYIKDKGLGGAFYWESSADKKGPESLIGTIAESLGKLEQSENLLSYSSSAYANMAAGMPGQ